MLPLLYHSHHARFAEDLPFWLGLAAQAGDPILELGCGSGRVLTALAQAGYRVFGLDLDRAMLACLRQLAGQAAPPVFQADMAAFRLGLGFRLVILPCNTFSTLSENERRATLTCVRQHLQAGGTFAVSLPNPAQMAVMPAQGRPEIEDIFPHPLDGEPVQVSDAWRRTRHTLQVWWHYDHLLPDGTVERLSLSARHSLAPAAAYLDEMTAAGLTVQAVLGDYGGSPYQPDSPALIILAS